MNTRRLTPLTQTHTGITFRSDKNTVHSTDHFSKSDEHFSKSHEHFSLVSILASLMSILASLMTILVSWGPKHFETKHLLQSEAKYTLILYLEKKWFQKT